MIRAPFPLLDCRDLTVYRGDRVALDRLTLSIGQGEHVAILGPNGCGKSTLVKTLTRECYPISTVGHSPLRILGQDAWDLFELRNLLGIVTNDLIASCAIDVTARETILSGFFSSVRIWPHMHVTGEMERRTLAILERLSVGHLADRRMNELSSGEARRVVIGRALVHAPAALVLDEPTNSLDLAATHDLREMVRRIAQDGTTVVLVTHHLPDIIPEIDRVVLLKAGRVVADGPKNVMLTSARLSELFGATVEVSARDGYFAAW